MSAEPGDVIGSVWLRTEPDIDGTYRLSLEMTEDESVFLDRQTALAHGSYVLAITGAAEFDAKVYRQLAELTGDPKSAAQVIGDLRADRALPEPPTRLVLTPGVNSAGRPFLTVSLAGSPPFGQWELADAREHARAAIEAVHVADYDSGYLRALTGLVGLDQRTARNVIDALSRVQVDSD